MKKIISVLLVFALIFSTVGCSQLEKKSGVDKAKQLIIDEEYEEAIDELEEVLGNEELNLDAWDLIAEAYIKAGEFEKADEWLEQYLELIDEHLDDSGFDLARAIDSVGDYARDILREGQTVGSWYETLKPAAINLDDLDYEYELGTELEFAVPSGSDIYFSFNGSPRTQGTKYINNILLNEEGYMYLDLVVVNKYGEYSAVTSGYFDVYDPSYSEDDYDDMDEIVDLVLPEVNLRPGTYKEYSEVQITNYDVDNDNLMIMYTTDGSDPRDYESLTRYYYGRIPLSAGNYNLGITVYDYNSDEYSDVAYLDYYIDNPDMVRLGLFMLPDAVVEAYKVMFDEAGSYGLFVEPVAYDIMDLANFDLESLPDILITYGTYAEDLVSSGVIANVENYFNLADYEFVGQADNIGMYNGVKYMMPLTIRPEYMVYGDYEGLGLIDWDYIQGQSDWYSNRFAFAADSPELFLGVYYGLGGEVLNETASNIDATILLEALTVIQTLPDLGIGDKLYSMSQVMDGLYEYHNEYFVMDNSIENNPDYYFYQLGQMPLPNGDFAKYYNVATGLYLSNLSVTLDPGLQSKIVEIYNYMITDSYYMSDIAMAEGSLPANMSQAEDYEFYLNMPLEDYIGMIDNGISSMRSYALYAVYEALEVPLQELVNGVTPEEVVNSIMLNFSQGSN